MAEDIKEVAARVKTLGAQLAGAHTPEELREVWRRLPNVRANPPKGGKALAERVALYLIDLNDEAPKDMKAFLETEPLRPFGPLQEAGAAPTDGEGADSTPASAGGESTSLTTGEESMQTQTNAGRGKRVGSSAHKATKAKTTSSKRAKKAVVDKDTGPRPGTIQALIVKLSLDGKTSEQIVKAVAKEFPKMKFAKMDEAAQKGHVSWYKNNARKKGWLPKVN